MVYGNLLQGDQIMIDNLSTFNKKTAYETKVDIVKIQIVKEKSITYGKSKISHPEDGYNLVKNILLDCDRETLLVCCLDMKNKPTAINTVSIGTLNSSLVHPREVFKPAILSNSASIILYHNHPSGDPEPSKEDINITLRLKKCGEILGIDLLDHIIIGEEKYISLKNKGII